MYRLPKEVFNTDSGEYIQATCRRCGNKAPAKDFRIDDELKIMVCNECFTRPRVTKTPSNLVARGLKEEVKPKVVEAPARTIIIHSEDDIFRAPPIKKELVEKPKEITKPLDNRVNFACDMCGFRFKYNLAKNWPNKCPACARTVNPERAKKFSFDLF